MGGLSSSLGFAGGKDGSGTAAPQAANIVNPVTGAMTDQAYTNAQTGLTQQNAFVQALQAQNGVGNQSSVFNQLQGVANGTGPNPAQAQLAQSTGQNVANQAALMAGQRGANANVGLMARQASQVGAQTQQQSAGQAATMQANQSMNALNSMGSLATNQVSQQAAATNAYSSAAQGEQSNLYNMLGGVNSANTSSQGSLNSANAALIGQSVNNQNGFLSSMAPSGGQVMSMFADGGQVSYGGTQVAQAPQAAQTSSITANQINLGSSYNKPQGQTAAKAPANQTLAGGAGDNVLSDGTMMAAEGGEVEDSSAEPQATTSAPPPPPAQDTSAPVQQLSMNANSGPQSSFGQAVQGISAAPQSAPVSYGGTQAAQAASGPSTAAITTIPYGSSGGSSGGGGGGGMGGLLALMANGGKVPAMVSPGEQYLPPKDVKKVVKGEAKPLNAGERIPGKPKVKGNSYANDVVHKKLDPGGIVIPNSVMQSSDPQGNAMKFIAATMKEQGLRKGKK